MDNSNRASDNRIEQLVLKEGDDSVFARVEEVGGSIAAELLASKLDGQALHIDREAGGVLFSSLSPLQASETAFRVRHSVKADAAKGPSSSTRRASNAPNAAAEVRTLISHKKTIHQLIQHNKEYCESLQEAIHATKRARLNLEKMRDHLKRASYAEREDQILVLQPLHFKEVQLPLYATAQMASQSDDIEQLRLMVCSYPWSIDERQRLRKAVLSQCRRLLTLQMATLRDCPDNLLDLVADWSDGEMLSHSVPRSEDEEEMVDWDDIANQVGNTHTPDECRTRWLMEDRPNISHSEWTDEEDEQLRQTIGEILLQSVDGIVRDWEAVAKVLNSGRLGIDCFIRSQQNDMVPMYAATSLQSWDRVPLSEAESRRLHQLASIWDPHQHAVIASQLGTGRPSSSLPSPKAARPTASTQPIKWTSRADNALVIHVARENRMQRSRMLQNIDKVGVIDFAKQYRGRPALASAGEVERRWKYIKTEHRNDPSKYLAPPKVRQESTSTQSDSESKLKNDH